MIMINHSDQTIRYRDFVIHFLEQSSLDDFLQEIFVREEYFFESSREGPFIIDCGSHIGLSILYFKNRYPRAKILGFEPDPNNFKLLQRNIKEGHLENVSAHQVALANTVGKRKFYGYIKSERPVSLGNSLLSTWGKRTGTDEILVETNKLSEYITEEVDFLKLNIEGGEQEVLEDLFASGKISLVRQLYLQYHQTASENTDDQMKAALAMLKRNGFVIRKEKKVLEAYLPEELKLWADTVHPTLTVFRCGRSDALKKRIITPPKSLNVDRYESPIH